MYVRMYVCKSSRSHTSSAKTALLNAALGWIETACSGPPSPKIGAGLSVFSGSALSKTAVGSEIALYVHERPWTHKRPLPTALGSGAPESPKAPSHQTALGRPLIKERPSLQSALSSNRPRLSAQVSRSALSSNRPRLRKRSLSRTDALSQENA